MKLWKEEKIYIENAEEMYRTQWEGEGEKRNELKLVIDVAYIVRRCPWIVGTALYYSSGTKYEAACRCKPTFRNFLALKVLPFA